MVTSDLPRQVFTDPSCWPVLRRIVVHSIYDHKSLVLLCRNVRSLLLTDPDIRDRYFHTIYGLPVRPPSLDFPYAGSPKEHRSPPDTEAYYREQALQNFAPSLIRCVHTEGPVEDVRDGYMVTLRSTGEAAATKQVTGWTVWYLPQWHDVQKGYHTNRDTSKMPRADPLMAKDMPLPPRPAGAVNSQNLWRWDFDLGTSCSVIAIRPEDNLLVVVTSPLVGRYSITDEKTPSLAARRHRISFFQLRPAGLALRSDKPTCTPTKPIPHPEAARPYVQIFESVTQATNVSKYRLKIGPDGKVGLLILSREGQERSGPLAVWNWRRGECVGYFPPREGKVNFLDFDFYTNKHVALLEACAPPPPPFASASNSTVRTTPFKIRLVVLRLGGKHPVCSRVTVRVPTKVTSANPTGTTSVHLPHVWLMQDLRQDKFAHLVSLEMPPMLDRTLRMSAQQLPLATLYGRICLNPAVSTEYFLGSLAFSIGCKRGPSGTPSSSVVRGAVPASLIASLIPLSVKTKIIKAALAQWVAQADLPSDSYSQETIRRKMEEAMAHRVSTKTYEELGVEWDETFLDDFRFSSGTDLFRDIVACADELAAKVKRGASVKPSKSLVDILGGPAGLKTHSEAFARLLSPLACTFADSAVIPFSTWCMYADLFITPSGQVLDAHGSRVVYLDQNGATTLAGKNLKQDLPAELTDRRCYLVMRNYAVPMLQFPKSFNMAASQWFWHSGNVEDWQDRILEPLHPARAARYVKCQGKTIHPPWLGAQVLGSAHWQDRDLPVPSSNGDGPARSSAPFTELRVPLVADKAPIKGVYFDGQTIVLAQADRVTLVSF